MRFRPIWVDLGRFESIWVDLGRFGSIWVDLGRFRSIWVDLVDLGRFVDLSIWVDLGRCGSIWVDLGRFESIWVDFERNLEKIIDISLIRPIYRSKHAEKKKSKFFPQLSFT